MEKVTKLQTKQHVYELDHCAGCGQVIEGEYTELGLPSADDKRVKHIALCDSCTKTAESAGVI